MFWFNKKNKKKEEAQMPTEDEKEIKKAKTDEEEKGKTPDQTDSDRASESVGEQEKSSDKEDSQTAKDRIDESEGAENADKKEGDVAAKDSEEIKALRGAIAEEFTKALAPLLARLDGLENAEKQETKEKISLDKPEELTDEDEADGDEDFFKD